MGNSVSCEVLRLGYVKLRMWDGTVRIIKEVMCVCTPDLKRNLVLLECWIKVAVRIRLKVES